MSKPNPYINTFYLAVHLALNVLVIALVIDIVDAYFPIKHFFSAYHLPNINLHGLYPPTTLAKNIAAATVALSVAYWYYQKKKAKNADTTERYHYHLPNLRELEEFIRSKF